MHQNPRVVGGEACLAHAHVVEVDDTGRAVAPALILVRRLRAIESGDLHACRHLARGEHVPVRQVGVRLPLELRLVAARRAWRYRPAVLHLPVRIVGCVLALVLERAVARGPVRQDRRHVNKERQAALQRRAGLVDHLATKKVLRTAQRSTSACAIGLQAREHRWEGRTAWWMPVICSWGQSPCHPFCQQAGGRSVSAWSKSTVYIVALKLLYVFPLPLNPPQCDQPEGTSHSMQFTAVAHKSDERHCQAAAALPGGRLGHAPYLPRNAVW